MKIDEKGRYDLDSLEPGQGVARFWDGHEEPLEYWKHVYDRMIFYTPSGEYMYNTKDRTFYRLVWQIVEMPFVGTYNDKYEERAINVNNEIISIWYKEKEND